MSSGATSIPSPLKLDEDVMRRIRNNVWKDVRGGWVIMCDMDEYLCVDHRQLSEEEEKGTTVLTTRGLEIVGGSESPDLDDVDITLYDQGHFSHWYSKKVCFLREAVVEMDYGHGCHPCRPVGRITYSKREYSLYHMSADRLARAAVWLSALKQLIRVHPSGAIMRVSSGENTRSTSSNGTTGRPWRLTGRPWRFRYSR
jgi:hypothetical protein